MLRTHNNIAFPAFFFSLSLLFAASVGVHAERNLVRNAAFEAGSQNWLFFGSGAPGRIEIETSDVRSGHAALRVINPTGAKVRAYQPPVVLNQIEPSPLRISYWCKRLSRNPETLQCADVWITYQDGTVLGWFTNTKVENLGKWVHYEDTFKPIKPIRDVSIWLLDQDATEDVLFDDVELTAEASPSDPARLLLSLAGDRLKLRFDAVDGRVLIKSLVLKTREGERDLLQGAPAGIRRNTNLWLAELVGPNGSRVVALPDRRSHLVATQHRLSGGGVEATLTWKGVCVQDEPVLDVTVRVRIPPGESLAYFTASVHFLNPSWGLQQLQFPVLAECPPLDKTGDKEVLVYPQGIGRLVRNPQSNLTALELPYGSHYCAFQMCAYHDSTDGIYYAAHDGRGYFKTFQLAPEPSEGLRFSIWQVPENTGEAGRDYVSPYPSVIGAFHGDWLTAAKIYRGWALQQRWCGRGPLALRTDLPGPVRRTSLWEVGLYWDQGKWPNYTFTDLRRLPADVLRAAHPPLSAKSNGEMAKGLLDAFGVPTASWWTCWSVGAFDVGTGRYIMPRGFAEAAHAVTSQGVSVVPYFNIRRFDTATEEWKQDDLAKAVVVGENRQTTLEPLSGSLTAVMCPATPLWQEKFIAACLPTVSQGATGIYLDELATAGIAPCYAPQHHHPLGGGAHWIEGRREILRRLHQAGRALNKDFFTAGEEPCEAYIDVNDYAFTYGSRNSDNIPLWMAIYHDYAMCAGRPVGKWYVSDAINAYPPELRSGDAGREEFVTAMGAALIFGIQPGWIRPDLAQFAPETAKYFKRLVTTYHHAKPFLLYGEMVRATHIETSLPMVHATWRYQEEQSVEFPAVLSSAWRSPANTLGIVLANIDTKAHSLRLQLRPEDYPFLRSKAEWQVNSIDSSGAIYIN